MTVEVRYRDEVEDNILKKNSRTGLAKMLENCLHVCENSMKIKVMLWRVKVSHETKTVMAWSCHCKAD